MFSTTDKKTAYMLQGVPQDERFAPAVAVLMPVYNAERYVAEATESILNQTFADFEFIIIDDGSTDGSLKILERYAARDARIRLLSRENRGLVSTLNEGIGLARAPLIARMDADDVSLPERFEKQVEYMAHHPMCVALGTGMELIDEKGRLLLDSPSHYNCHKTIVDALMRGHSCLVHPSAMLRREPVRRIEGYRPKFRAGQDYDLWLRLSEVGELANLAEPLLRYRDHSQAVSSLHGVEQFESARRAFEEACERRGVAGTFELLGPHRGGRTGAERKAWMNQRYRTVWWWTYEAGRWPTALVYAWKCVVRKPWHPGNWWLVAKTLIAWGRDALGIRLSSPP